MMLYSTEVLAIAAMGAIVYLVLALWTGKVLKSKHWQALDASQCPKCREYSWDGFKCYSCRYSTIIGGNDEVD